MDEISIVNLFVINSVRDGYRAHPAWPNFVRLMSMRQYGADALTQAWFWFHDGWDRKATSRPSGAEKL